MYSCQRRRFGGFDSLHAGFFSITFYQRLLVIYFFETSVFKNSLSNAMRVSNSLDQDQDRQHVGPGLDPNCLQRLSKDGTIRRRVNGVCHVKT